MATRPEHAVTVLLRAAESGDAAARDELMSTVYQEMRRATGRTSSPTRGR
jgi:hypothetical protein